MSVVSLLYQIKEWLENEICEDLEFKKPPETDDYDAEDYDFELIKPSVFIMYPPPSSKFPSLTIQFGDGKREINEESGELSLRLLFATWSPGTHYLDDDENQQITIDNEGWRDVWNFIDYALRKLSDVVSIGDNIRIKHEDAITFGPMTEQDTMANYYPHWCGWIKFTIQYGVQSTNEDFSDLI